MAREAKFTFIPAHLAKKVISEDSGLWKASIYTNPQKVITFPSRHPETVNLIGKYVTFFVDIHKNTLGWKVFKQGELGDLTNAVAVRKTMTTGDSYTVKIPIANALNAMKFTQGNSYKALEVERYREQGMLNDGHEIFYVTIKEEKAEKRTYKKREKSPAQAG